MKDQSMLDVNKYDRYESPKLKEWKQLDKSTQLTKVTSLNEKYKDKVQVVKVYDQSIEINLFIKKEGVYDFLVEYETYIRDNLGGFPIIILLKDRADENKKRQ